MKQVFEKLKLQVQSTGYVALELNYYYYLNILKYLIWCGGLYFAFNLHTVKFHNPHSPKKERERKQEIVMCSCSLFYECFLLAPLVFQEGMMHVQQMEAFCETSRSPKSSDGTGPVISVFRWTNFSCPCVHARLCICQTISLHLIRYRLCCEHLVQFSSDFIARFGANCKIFFFFFFFLQ